jgi:hypothetical protein
VSAARSERPGAEAPRPPLVVVVVNWNGRHLLAECLGSLLENGYEPLEIVLVDNGSTDDSLPFVREAFPDVRILASPENRRWAGGNNLALQALLAEGVAGRYVLLLNNDTFVPGGSLARLVSALAAEPAAWVATPRICYWHDPARVWYDGGIAGRRTGWIRHHGIRRLAGRLSFRSRFVEWGTGCALLLRDVALVRAGLLDESYYFYGEDSDYCLRLAAAGGRILHVPAALVLHKVSDALGGQSPRKAYLKARSHVQLLRRHWPRRRWPVLIPCQVGYYAGLVAWHLAGGRPETARACLLGLLDELRGAPAAG